MRERDKTAKSRAKSYFQPRCPPPPHTHSSLLCCPLWCLMFERAFIPQIFCSLMNNAWASVANSHPPHSALSNMYARTHTHTLARSYLLHTLHSQMAWSRSFPQWMQDNWICQAVVFCCSDRSLYKQKKAKTQPANKPGGAWVCV